LIIFVWMCLKVKQDRLFKFQFIRQSPKIKVSLYFYIIGLSCWLGPCLGIICFAFHNVESILTMLL